MECQQGFERCSHVWNIQKQKKHPNRRNRIEKNADRLMDISKQAPLWTVGHPIEKIA